MWGLGFRVQCVGFRGWVLRDCIYSLGLRVEGSGGWFMVYGLWFMVYGVWCMVYGS